MVDLAVLALLLGLTVAGIYQGLVPQLFRIGALLLIWLLVKPLGMFFSVLLRPFGFPGLTGFYLGALIGGVILFGALSLLGRYLSDRFINTRTSRMEMHSKLGGYLGFITGVLVVTLVLFVLGALPEGYLEKKPRFAEQVHGSWGVWLANSINPFPRLTVFDSLSAYQRLLKDPDAVERLKEQPPFQKLRQHPAVREALADPKIARKLEELDYRFLLAEPKVARLLKDSEVRRLLIDLDPREALEAPPEPEPPAEVEEGGQETPETEGTPPEPERPSLLIPGEGRVPVLGEEPPSSPAPETTEGDEQR